MAMASGIFGITLRDILDTSGLAVDLIGAGHEFQLVTDTYTPNFDTHDFEADITNEISPSVAGDYTVGGEPFNTLALDAGSTTAGYLTLGAGNDVLTGMTATGIRGRVAFDDAVVSDPLTFATTFGADVAVTAGTLTINNSNGLLTIKYNPAA